MLNTGSEIFFLVRIPKNIPINTGTSPTKETKRSLPVKMPLQGMIMYKVYEAKDFSSKAKIALSAESPIYATIDPTNARYLFSEVTLERWRPRNELEPETIIDHREAAGR